MTQEEVIEQMHLKIDPYLGQYLDLVEQIEQENHIDFEAKRKAKIQINFDEEKLAYPEGT